MYLVGKIKYNDNMFECLYMYEKGIKSLYLKVDGIVTSGYRDIHGEISIYKNYIAQDICKDIQRFESYINSKGVNKETLVNSLGVNLVYTGIKNKTSFTITKLNNTDVVGLKVNNAIYDIDLSVSASAIEPRVDFVTITNDIYTTDLGDEIRTRSLDEIGIEKDITWLKDKEYKVLNKTSDILKLISILSKFKGIISYDTETTGLKINMFGQYGNKHRDKLIEINKELDVNSRYKVDELVGVCISIKENEGYYIPVKHKKFDNAFYDDKEKVANLKQRLYNKYKNYSFKGIQKNMQRYVLNLDSYEDIPNDVLLMEALRDILSSTESKILAHNCAFDWKVNHLYSIDTNFTDDTLLMHQLVYKFKDGKTMNSGLKTLTKELLGIDQLDLHDFFLGYTEDDSGLNRLSKKRKKDTLVDFSYMDYEGTRAYAPADADLTLQVYNILIKDFMENHRDEEYLYVTELQVAHAIGYMEFYGLRIDEDKIENARLRTLRDKLLLEHKIRLVGGMVTDKEVELLKELDVIDVNGDKDALDKLLKECEEVFTHEIAGLGSSFNLGSAQQACKYFYEDLGIECPQEKPSVAKGVIKQLKKLKNEDGSNKYQVIHDYADYKEMDTQLSKFYTQLPNYMYPGGYIFASYGQISTNTGRMSCKRPNNQQLPKYVTSLVIPREDSVFMDADFSQIEYRTLVALANEPTLKEQFKDPDNDYHTMMAALMFAIDYAAVTDVLRSAAKGLNFGIPYGMGIRALAIMLTGNDSPESIVLAQERYEQYFENQPNVRAFFEKVKQDAKQSGFTSTFWGRKRYYNFLTADGKYSRSLESRALRQAGNSVVQGCQSGDSRIQTKEYGIVKLKDVVDQTLNVWDGNEWTEGDILYSGKKQKCIIKFSGGQEIICSPDHKFLVVSHRGNKRFVDCKDLKSSQASKTPHRVCINLNYEPSDFKYTSVVARKKYTSEQYNAKNVFLDDIGDSFKIGVVLGRLASDGNICNTDRHKVIRQIVAEHEYNILPTLTEYMHNLGIKVDDRGVREGRTQGIKVVKAHSTSLVQEIAELDIKHKVHKNIFMDTELLRGFLRGFFDGDGGISGHSIALTFGKQYNFESMCKDIQKALLFFGVRSYYKEYKDRYKITIKTYDNQRFLDLIGFINEDKQAKGRELKCVRDEHIFGKVLVVESVEITDEYIDMYDVCNTERGYYVADGIITHNTAADIFKIAVARTWRYIRKNNLLGLVHISNLVHDEQLIEINVKELNVQRVLTDIINCMELNLEKYNFPPLFVGAGIGASWKDAKGKMAEIHPYLANRLKDESASYGLEDVKLDNAVDVLSYFKDRVYNYRKEVVATYLSGEGLTDTNFKASIGNLINLQFDYKLPDNIDTGNVNEVLYYRVGKFIDEFNLGIDVESYTSLKDSGVVVYDSEAEKDELEAINELEDELDLDSSEKSRGKEVVDNNTLGINPVDVARVFGYCLDVDRNLVVLNMDLGNTNLKVGYIKLHTNKDMGNKGIRCHLIIDGKVVEYKDLLYGVNVGNLDLIFLDKKY